MRSTLNKSRRGTESAVTGGEFKIAHLRKGSHWARNLRFRTHRHFTSSAAAQTSQATLPSIDW